MSIYTYYKISTGEIHHQYSGIEPEMQMDSGTYGYVEGAYDGQQYFYNTTTSAMELKPPPPLSEIKDAAWAEVGQRVDAMYQAKTKAFMIALAAGNNSVLTTWINSVQNVTVVAYADIYAATNSAGVYTAKATALTALAAIV